MKKLDYFADGIVIRPVDITSVIEFIAVAIISIVLVTSRTKLLVRF